ncbi:MAG: OmpA family protein [Flavobacterium sp.]|nr:OmpA family protein [Flavobacterium sp.]
MKTKLLLITIIAFSWNCHAQILDNLMKKAEKAAERTVERKVEQKVEKKTEEGMDKVLNPKKKSAKENNGTTAEKNSKKKKNAKSANDFVAGTKVIASDDFAQDAVGDFPVNWSTNSSGEVVTFDGSETKWLKLSDKGNFTPNNFKKLPDNFTFEFDLYSTEEFSYYSSGLRIGFIESKKKNDYLRWSEFKNGDEGVILGLHPQVAGGQSKGQAYFKVINNGGEIMTNEVETESYNNSNSTAKVQIWRQKNRLRMYINGDKIWDLPNAFQDAQYNGIVFYLYNYHEKDDFYYIANLRLAEAGKDTRHKLIETGSFTTNEILFDTNKSTIKPSSAKVLGELGEALKENPTVKINIIGHTDSDGKDSDNLKLSQQRAESVKNYLNKNFGIETSRMTTEGKGETEPISTSNTEEAKKQNRRVEFKII